MISWPGVGAVYQTALPLAWNNIMDSSRTINPTPLKGRGALSNADSRYRHTHSEAVDDGWEAQEIPSLHTTVSLDASKSILSRNDSPDIPFEQSLNPYRGCEHGCIYCYARPSHAYLGLSPGLDFETRLFAKPEAARLLRTALTRKRYTVSPLALGANTDPYQPIEREWRITRQVLEVLNEFRHPVIITTKSSLVERDIDIIAEMARHQRVQVNLSLTTLDGGLARSLEPRATSPERRLKTLCRLSEAGVPVMLLMSPIIPALNDTEIETLLARAAEAGARAADYILLRLPLELRDLFEEWLETHQPLKAQRVLNRLREVHGGDLYRPGFGIRQSGSGDYANMIRQRFSLAARRHGLDRSLPPLDCSAFRIPPEGPVQTDLFSEQTERG